MQYTALDTKPAVHADNQAILQASNLAIGYRGKQKDVRVSSQLNLTLGKGEFVCLLGPNGAGKSTLIRTLAGIQRPLSGQASIAGNNVFNISKKALSKKVSLVLTDRINSGNFSVYTLLTLGRYPYLNWFGVLGDNDKRIIHEAIAATGIEPFIDKSIFDLSDGERQKVMIARALVQDTPLIILDEPTAHLDLPNRVEIMRLLRRMVRTTGKSIILSTHELDLALQTADTIWLMMPGESLLAGTAEDLILDGTFERTFQKKGFDFCRETGCFKVNTPQDDKVIGLNADGITQFWTKRALEREGFQVHQQSACQISVGQCQDRQWTLNADGQVRCFDSIQALLLHLRCSYRIEWQ